MINQFKQIQLRFNKASKTYDNVSSVQKDAAKFLLKKVLDHQNYHPKSILDLGAGTGIITELLLKKFPKSSYYLNDIADEMLKVCKSKFSKLTNIYYLPGDMMKLNDNIYDYVLSNLALQWIDNLEEALKFFHFKSSKVFAFSTLLDGTFNEWENIINKYQLIKILNYPKADYLFNLCNKLKRPDQIFEFWLMDVPLFFNQPIDFMRYLKLLGASSSNKSIDILNLKKLLKFESQDLTVTYKIFFGIFKKVGL